LLAALQYSVDIMFINLNNEDGYDFLDRNGWLIGCSGRGCLENRLPGCPLFLRWNFHGRRWVSRPPRPRGLKESLGSPVRLHNVGKLVECHQK
jgi:hypothetical protein